MQSHFGEFDHLMFGATNLERACDEFRELGFVVGPVTEMTHMGFRNRRVLFRQTTSFAANFLEVVQFTRPTPSMPAILRHLNPRLEHGEQGANAIIFATPDADAAQVFYGKVSSVNPASGLRPDPIMVGDFPAEGPDGTPIQVRFRNCLLPELKMPVPVSLSQIQSWDFYQHEAWLQHANAARSIVGITVISGALEEDVGRYEWLLGRAGTRDGREVAHLTPANVQLSFMTPAAFARKFGVAGAPRKPPFIAALTLTSDSLDKTRRALALARCKTIDEGKRLVIAPLVENAVVLEFIS